MIRINMHGRLGNQMFQYAFARKIIEETKQDLLIDFKNVEKRGVADQGWKDSLEEFNVIPYEKHRSKIPLLFKNATMKQIIVGGIYFVWYKLLPYKKNLSNIYKRQIMFSSILNSCSLFWLSNGYYKFSNYKNPYLSGSFEDKKYFDSIKDILIEEFTPKKDISIIAQKFIEEIYGKETVCVSIRVFSEIKEDKQKASLYSVTDKIYYEKAMEYFKRVKPNAKFVIFTDDSETVKKQYSFDKYEVMYEPKGLTLAEKLYSMSKCSHFVISNSTFSWWAQYLCTSNNKIIVSPDKWFNSDYQPNLIEDEWIKICLK